MYALWAGVITLPVPGGGLGPGRLSPDDLVVTAMSTAMAPRAHLPSGPTLSLCLGTHRARDCPATPRAGLGFSAAMVGGGETSLFITWSRSGVGCEEEERGHFRKKKRCFRKRKSTVESSLPHFLGKLDSEPWETDHTCVCSALPHKAWF